MAASKLPPEVLRIIGAGEGVFSSEADQDVARLDIEWDDVVAVASSAEWRKRTRDAEGAAEYVEAVRGRDTHGRKLYTAGKPMQVEGEGTRWYVITIHESDK
ncbi:MAG: hypothetical protein HYY25_13390 [Candidatus Wallbacteria bacterium]|nr:hypothetical protein [Candidatus Wallbacteria bacterium]